MIQIFGMLLGYLLVTRCQNSFNRYREGIDIFVDMLSKWNDTFVLIVTYLRSTAARCDPMERRAKNEAVEKYIYSLAHLFSMLSGFAFASLGVDFGSGLTEDRKVAPNELKVRQIVQGRKSKKEPAGLSIDPNKTRILLEADPGKFVKLSYTPNSNPYELFGEYSKEEWFEIANSENPVALVTLWVSEELTMMMVGGDVTVPAPLVSRAYQELSNGLMAYKMAYLFAWVPFPFCFAQLVAGYMSSCFCGSPSTSP
jgi:hypothetical protein